MYAACLNGSSYLCVTFPIIKAVSASQGGGVVRSRVLPNAPARRFRSSATLEKVSLSILGVWEEEFEKFAAFPYTLTILKGASAKKRQQLSEVGKTDGLEIVVVNYESARILETELLKFNADLIIADEGHKLKENRSQQSKTIWYSRSTER